MHATTAEEPGGLETPTTPIKLPRGALFSLDLMPFELAQRSGAACSIFSCQTPAGMECHTAAAANVPFFFDLPSSDMVPSAK